MKDKYTIVIAGFFLAIIFLIFLPEKINFATADLGRHLKNGEFILKGNFNVLKENFYSFSNPHFPFLNHHWGSGVIFYILNSIGGIKLVHIFYIVLFLAAFEIFSLISANDSSKISLVIGTILIPLIAQRQEVRPEVFTYLFSGIFFATLWRYKKNKISSKHVFLILLPLFLLWTNLHIFFFWAWIITSVFLIDSFFIKEKQKQKNLLALIILGIGVSLISPFTWKIFTYPFHLVKNYGYRIVENQSIFFLERLGVENKSLFWLFKIMFLMWLFSLMLIVLKKKKLPSLPPNILAGIAGITAILAVRNISLFGLFVIPALSLNTKEIIKEITKNKFFSFSNEELSVIVITAAVLSIILFSSSIPSQWGIGFLPKINNAGTFMRSHNIKGPIFNNYDIGSYLIFHLFPKEKVFVDNRPEAYPKSFLQNEYILGQKDESVWQSLKKKYNFNAIVFWWHDYTPWAQEFLIRRINDKQWVPVFADNFVVVFVKNIPSNSQIIKKYKVPSSIFKIKKIND